jgi:hypothetical protein
VESRKRYLRMRTSRIRTESWPITRPCVKVGWRENRWPFAMLLFTGETKRSLSQVTDIESECDFSLPCTKFGRLIQPPCRRKTNQRRSSAGHLLRSQTVSFGRHFVLSEYRYRSPPSRHRRNISPVLSSGQRTMLSIMNWHTPALPMSLCLPIPSGKHSSANIFCLALCNPTPSNPKTPYCEELFLAPGILTYRSQTSLTKCGGMHCGTLARNWRTHQRTGGSSNPAWPIEAWASGSSTAKMPFDKYSKILIATPKMTKQAVLGSLPLSCDTLSYR